MNRSVSGVSRRGLLLGGLALAGLPDRVALAEQPQAIHVAKGTGCECCSAWIAHLKENGFVVTEEELYGALLIRFKLDHGVPPNMQSCHTGKVAGYVIEGHVPASDINRLLEEAPDAVGLAVPGMPYGSPGMGAEDSRDAYDVHLIKRDGTSVIFSSYAAA